MGQDIALNDSAGKTIIASFRSYFADKCLLAFSDGSLMVIGATVDFDGDVILDTEGFNRSDFDLEDLGRVFSAEQVEQWAREDEECQAQRLEQAKAEKRRLYEQLKSELERHGELP